MRNKGIVGGQIITISPNQTPCSQNPDDLNGQKEMCLVGVYSDAASELFSYWTPFHSGETVASVLFRNWRYCVQHKRSQSPLYDLEVWTDTKDVGDGWWTGSRMEHWSALLPLLTVRPQTEILPTEAVYERLRDTAKLQTPDPTTDLDVEGPTDGLFAGTTQYSRHRVLKLQLCTYESPELIERKQLEKQKRLSRMAVTKQGFLPIHQ
jgi:hypothetical protein